MNLIMTELTASISNVINAAYADVSSARVAACTLAEQIAQATETQLTTMGVECDVDTLSNVIRQFDKGFSTKELLIEKCANQIGTHAFAVFMDLN